MEWTSNNRSLLSISSFRLGYYLIEPVESSFVLRSQCTSLIIKIEGAYTYRRRTICNYCIAVKFFDDQRNGCDVFNFNCWMTRYWSPLIPWPRSCDECLFVSWHSTQLFEIRSYPTFRRLFAIHIHGHGLARLNAGSVIWVFLLRELSLAGFHVSASSSSAQMCHIWFSHLKSVCQTRLPSAIT